MRSPGSGTGVQSRRRLCFAGRWVVRFGARPSGLQSGWAAWTDVRFVIRAHRAQRAHLMVGEFVIGITMLGAEDASCPRVTSRRAIRLDFDAMSVTFGDVPSSGETHGAYRTCADATAHRTSGTWIELDHRAGEIVEGIVALAPSGVLHGMGSEGAPESAAAIADHDNRTGVGENRGRTHHGRCGKIVAVGRDRSDKVEAVGRGCVADDVEQITHAIL